MLLYVLANAGATQATIPHKTGSDLPLNGIFSVFSIMILLLLVVYAGLWIAKKYGLLKGFSHFSDSGKHTIDIKASTTISAQTKVFVIKYKSKEYLLAEHAQGIKLLDDLSIEEDKETADEVV